MAVKRKISIRKILQLFVTLVVTVCCIIAMVSASRIEDNKVVKKIAIHIKNDKKYHFIEQQEIMDLAIIKPQIDLEHTPVSKLDIRGMEHTIMADPWVAGAQVYIDNEDVLQMHITQRIPVARVFDRNGRTYYLDTTLSIMPVSVNYIYYATTITNMPDLKNDSMGWAVRKDLITLVRTLQADPFWAAQVSQVIIDSPGMYELVPVLGDHRIIFGDVSRMKDKLANLFLFYKNVLNRIGWDKYETLDLRFRGQVVASPSLPYKGPVDKAVVTMNWINSIVETEAKNDAINVVKDSVKAAVTKINLAKADKSKVVIGKIKKPAPKVLSAKAAVLKKKAAVIPVKNKAKKSDKKPAADPVKPLQADKAKNTADKNNKQNTDKKVQDKKDH